MMVVVVVTVLRKNHIFSENDNPLSIDHYRLFQKQKARWKGRGLKKKRSSNRERPVFIYNSEISLLPRLLPYFVCRCTHVFIICVPACVLTCVYTCISVRMYVYMCMCIFLCVCVCPNAFRNVVSLVSISFDVNRLIKETIN